MDYNSYHADIANSYLNVTEKKVLVVGCNRGKDVSYFVEFGAEEVVGIDIMDEVGKEYSHQKAKYYQMSAENMDIKDNSFDLVYCFATMEHIPNIEKAFSEMVRVAKAEGIIYCVASPLWNSRQGHHYSHIFDIEKYPWIHLTLTKEQIKDQCNNGKIDYPDWINNIDDHIDYILESQDFNRYSAQDYIKTCRELENIEIIRNDLDLEPEYYLGLLSVDDFKKLVEKNINSTELLALTHTFVAKKKELKPIHSKHDKERVLNNTNPLESDEIELQNMKNELEKAYKEIEAIKTSKFWKLRSLWFKVKKSIGLPTE
ncbi:MAG: class I SAM-dependent methyltransferase [Crocosphaera sp.]